MVLLSPPLTEHIYEYEDIFKYILYEDKTVFWPQLLHCSNLEKTKQCFFLQNEILRGRRRSGSS